MSQTTVAAAGLRERKKAATRQSLQEAALALATERGLAHLTVEAIAEAADVSPRTFFNYFSSKEEALLGHDPARPAALAAALAARPADEPPLAALRAVLTDMAGTFAENPASWQARAQLIHDHPELRASAHAAFGVFERTLVEAVAARTDRDPDRDLYPGLVAAAAVAALRVAVLHWRTTGRTDSLPSLVDETFAALADGLSLPQRR